MEEFEQIVVPYESASQIRAFLIRNGACRKSLEWSKGKDLVEIWNTCTNDGWMSWLVRHKARVFRDNDHGWGDRRRVLRLEFLSYQDYEVDPRVFWRKYYAISPAPPKVSFWNKLKKFIPFV